MEQFQTERGTGLSPEESYGDRLCQLYQSHGYLPYRMSKFEEYDLYVKNKSFLVSENILTFTDTDGRLMALKPDVTLSIVKNSPESAGALQKVYYRENVYRTSPAAVGYREIMQAGLECIGDIDLYAMGEVLSMADESLALIQDDYLLDISHLGIVAGLLEGLEESVQQELLAEIERKNLPAIEALCARLGYSDTLAQTAGQLAMLYGPPEKVLPVLETMAENDTVRAALAELKALCRLLTATGHAEHLRLDFSIVGGMRYYNGIVFRGYLPELAASVLAGGRYDNLLRQMGKTGGAIGFAVYLDQLERLECKEADYDVDTLLLYDPEDDPERLAKLADVLRRQGRSVRVEREVPPGLRYRVLDRLQKGGNG
jgi:ATP phosphoribosyltransferase regulatory subunit